MADRKSASNNIIPSECPMHADYVKPVAPPSECPMHAGGSTNSEAPLDPANMMPPANQQPSPGQPFKLNTDRVTSSIPRGGTEKNWQYPSEQMFWNAMLRKGWRWEKDTVNEKDMSHIIRIHNSNNERAWNEVLKWEIFRGTDINRVKLMKFGGKASQYSPRARMRAAMGYDFPFDRHDWVIDRGDHEARYVIDYYDTGDENGYKTGEFVDLDVRPALDSFAAGYQRSRAAMYRWVASAVTWFRTPSEPPAEKHS